MATDGKKQESCPYCQNEVWVEPTQRRRYRCPSCGKDFTHTPDRTPTVLQAPMPSSGASVPPRVNFVETPFIRDLVHRALAYLKDGLPIHLTGPAGGGKTTLALYVAHQLNRPVVLVHGDDQMGTADLVGRESGHKRSYTRDQFIHTVLKIEEETKPLWVGRALTEACEKGYTVVYDEFTRSRPEANNVLLSVLEERALPLRGSHIAVHPDFRIIFTSNPAEYAGVHGAQDALLDRMLTIHLGGLDQETEVAIAHARSGLPLPDVERLVALVRTFRQGELKPAIISVRASIMIARILRVQRGHALAGDPVFLQTCRDVLLSEARRMSATPESIQLLEEMLQGRIQELCSAPLPLEPIGGETFARARESDPALAEVLRDREVEELLLRKIREKALAGKPH